MTEIDNVIERVSTVYKNYGERREQLLRIKGCIESLESHDIPMEVTYSKKGNEYEVQARLYPRHNDDIPWSVIEHHQPWDVISSSNSHSESRENEHGDWVVTLRYRTGT